MASTSQQSLELFVQRDKEKKSKNINKEYEPTNFGLDLISLSKKRKLSKAIVKKPQDFNKKDNDNKEMDSDNEEENNNDEEKSDDDNDEEENYDDPDEDEDEDEEENDDDEEKEKEKEEENIDDNDNNTIQTSKKRKHSKIIKKSNKKKEKRRPKATAKARQIANQYKDAITLSGVSNSNIRSGSYVWQYFHRSKDQITSTCAVIMPDGKECGVYYNDGSTTTNLINHLARKHKVFRPTEKQKVRNIIINKSLKKLINIIFYFKGIRIKSTRYTSSH